MTHVLKRLILEIFITINE